MERETCARLTLPPVNYCIQRKYVSGNLLLNILCFLPPPPYVTHQSESISNTINKVRHLVSCGFGKNLFFYQCKIPPHEFSCISFHDKSRDVINFSVRQYEVFFITHNIINSINNTIFRPEYQFMHRKINA